MVAIAVTYNALAIPLRASYGEIVEGDHVIIMWLVFDYLFDLIFLMDLLVVQPLTCKATTERYKVRVQSYQHHNILQSVNDLMIKQMQRYIL